MSRDLADRSAPGLPGAAALAAGTLGRVEQMLLRSLEEFSEANGARWCRWCSLVPSVLVGAEHGSAIVPPEVLEPAQQLRTRRILLAGLPVHKVADVHAVAAHGAAHGSDQRQ